MNCSRQSRQSRPWLLTCGLWLLSCSLWLLTTSLLAQEPQRLVTRGHELISTTRYEEAVEAMQAAVELSRQLGEPRAEAEAMIGLSYALLQSGASQRSIACAEQAIELFSRLDIADREGMALCDLASAHAIAKQWPEARTRLDRAEKIFRRLEDVEGLLRVGAERSLVEVRTGEYADALQYGQPALQHFSDLGRPQALDDLAMRALSAVSYAEHKLHRLDDALAHYEELIELAWPANEQRHLNFAFCNRAEIRWLQGQAKPAFADLQRAIDGWEQARSRVGGTADQRANFLARQVVAYDRMIRFLADSGNGAKGFEFAERFNGRSFLEMLDDDSLRTLGQQAPQLWRQRQALLDEIGTIRLAADAATDERTLSRLAGELQSVESGLLWQRRQHGSVPAMARPPKIKDVQAALQPGEVLVAYWLSDDLAYAWAIGKEHSDFVYILIPRSELESKVTEFLAPLRSARRAEDAALKGEEDRHLRLGQELYRLLIGSLPQTARQAKRLILVPDGILHYLPFEALVSGCAQAADDPSIHAPYAQCSYLGLETPTVYSPSAGIYLQLRQRQAKRSPREVNLLAFAPDFPGSQAVERLPNAEMRNAARHRAPLAFAKDEVQRIGGLFAGARLRFDRQASEQRWKTEAADYRLLHLATHGLVSDELPLSSGLLLRGDEQDDGLLHAQEVLGLRLDADLVTLSACRTGRGRLRRGEGIIGLSRAFLAAGSSSVVVSLWDVDDRSTPILMEAFYRQLAAGKSPAEAMMLARRHLFEQQTEAKLVFRTRPLAYAHPRFWASFIVIGGP